MTKVDSHASPGCSMCDTLPAIIISLLILICYADTFDAAFQLDDKPGIVINQTLHIDNLSPATLRQTFFAKPSAENQLYRPVANLTFALNWYIGGNNPAGYHLANIVLHCITSLILYLLVLRLLDTPVIRGRFDIDDTRFIAIFGTLLWALNPIQTQAVTYVVQRMAVLAALFYLLGIYFYVQIRLNQERHLRIISSIGCLLCYLLAVGSKENAIMLPVSLVLVEWVFITPSFGVVNKNRDIPWMGIAIVLAYGLLITAFAVSGRLNGIVGGYDNRPFTMLQRMMTEARVVLWYLGLIFYPSPLRLSITHDLQMSSSLISPWTTLPAILLIASMTLAAIRRIRKNTLMGFCVLFFFLNHVVESTILPLEPIFEHRNYLPSCFLFFPVAAGVKSMLDVYRQKKNILYLVLLAGIPLILILFGVGTHLRNDAWQTERTLWEDAIHKAPQSARPSINLAQILAKSGSPQHVDQALKLYTKSLSLRMDRNDIKAGVLGNMGGIYANYKQDVRSAIEFYQRSLEINPEYVQARFDLSVLLAMQGRWDAAIAEIDQIIAKGIIHENYFNLKALARLWKNQPDEALYLFKVALNIANIKTNSLVGTGASLCATGQHRQAERFLHRAYDAQPDSIMMLFLLIENAIKGEDFNQAEKWTQQLLKDHGLVTIQKWLGVLPTFYQFPPLSADLIAAYIYSETIPIVQEMKPIE